MEKDNKKFFNRFQNLEPRPELFDRIILAIKREQEFQKTKRLLFGFLFLFVVSLVATPLSWKMLVSQAKNSGILYFISTAVYDFGTFINLWKEFSLAILESLPIVEIIFFATNLIIFLFTIHLFLSRKRLFLAYLIQK
jgi:hypothetical protein